MTLPAAKIELTRGLTALAEEYRAVREATLAFSAVPAAPTGYDYSALGLAYHPLKERNHLGVLVNRALRRAAIPALPIEVQINNIGFCNLRCPQCPTHGTDELHAIYQSKAHTMSRAAVDKIAADTFRHTKKVVTSGTGEGLLHKDMEAIASHAARYGVHIFINSNGTTLLPKLLGRLFGITELRLSIDGATPAVFEQVRRGADYRTVMRNALVVSRANQRLPASLRLHPTVNYGICASSARDMPVMVDLCAYLGLSGLYGFRIVPLNPKYPDDDIEKYPAYYKHYYLMAMQRAQARNMIVNLPAPDPHVAPDPNAGPQSDEGMIVTGVDDTYYARLPHFDQLIDVADIEPDVDAMVAAALQGGIERHQAAKPAAVRTAAAEAQELEAAFVADMQKGFAAVAPEDLARLKSMHTSTREVRDCFFLQAHLVYNADGAVRPCCDTVIAPVGDMTMKAGDILRGEKLGRLVGEFARNELRPDCQRCTVHQMTPERQIFPIAFT